MTKKILVVDDSTRDLKNLSDAFDRMTALRIPGTRFLDVDYCTGVDHAISTIGLHATARKFGSKTIDLIITDFDMPGTADLAKADGLGGDNGNTIARYAHDNLPGIKVIGHTGGDPSRFDSRYVSAAVSKITDPYLLAGLIRTTLGGGD
jgi:CheY-like chemotaxis protein